MSENFLVTSGPTLGASSKTEIVIAVGGPNSRKQVSRKSSQVSRLGGPIPSSSPASPVWNLL